MALSTKKTAIAISLLLTCLATGAQAQVVSKGNTIPQHSPTDDTAQSAGAETPAQNENLAIIQPPSVAEKDADENKDDEPSDQQNIITDALDAIHEEKPQTGTIEDKPPVTTGPIKFVKTASEIEKTLMKAKVAVKQLAQTRSDKPDAKSQAGSVLANVLKDLHGKFTKDEIMPVLLEKVNGMRVDQIVESLAPTVGGKQKAKKAVKKVMNDMAAQQVPESDVIEALETDVAKIAKSQPQPEAAAKPEPPAVPEITADDLAKQQEGLDFKELSTSVDSAAALKEKMAKIGLDKPTTEDTALLDANFKKIAKRTKVWLTALNEQAAILPKEKSVERANDLAGQFMTKDYLRSIKQEYRAAHIMGKEEVNEFLEVLADAIYAGAGKKRTAVWELDTIFPLYPSSRMHFDYQEIVTNGPFNAVIDELANQKAVSLAMHLVSDNIVNKLSVSGDEDSANADVSMIDHIRKMFLDSGKSIDTSRLSPKILKDFEVTVLERPETVSAALISMCHDQSDRLNQMIQEQSNEIKADYNLYSTFAFLNDDLTASIEKISEHIALQESKVSTRFTATLVNDDKLEIKRPNTVLSLVDTFMSDDIQNVWAGLTANSL